MISETSYICDIGLIKECCKHIDSIETPLVLNEPTGDFFVDPWKLKKDFENTCWAKIYHTIYDQVGQARVISLSPGTCYHCHADIDDRYHLNLTGEKSYLVDLDEQKIYKIEDDGKWYMMNASKIHSAVNFGRYIRYQLVVRKLLPKNILTDPVNIKIASYDLPPDDARFIFDNNVSSWLNISYKKNKINNFRYDSSSVNLSIEKDHIDSLINILPNNLKVTYND
jgi:hypothetical protein